MKQWEKLTAWLVVFALVAGLVGGSALRAGERSRGKQRFCVCCQ